MDGKIGKQGCERLIMYFIIAGDDFAIAVLGASALSPKYNA